MTKQFDSTKSQIKFKFECTKCGNEVFYEETDIPHPDYSADNVEESRRCCDTETIVCPKCQMVFEVNVCRDMYHGTILVLHPDYKAEIEKIEIVEE